ncbi:hypothetical protein lerEdw1_011429 [Lerista edwardsae]|nr:hypothetical protein lerEdw1_011429 [Lerista edwardsae]
MLSSSLFLPGPTAAHLLTAPESPIHLSAGNTALLSVSLNFSPLVPEYFQLRWRFDTGQRLVLILKADRCLAGTAGPRPWRDSCRINIVKLEGYKHRAELGSENASLVLQNVRAEDSGNYSVTVLAFNLKLSANIILTVTEVEAPVTLMTAAGDRDYEVTNAIQLSVAGVILCLLGLILAEVRNALLLLEMPSSEDSDGLYYNSSY